ncbi:MAG TPA: efflux RND transporter periplasmic adaptor subunit [Bryobacteraceae bacterium]|nr:efflux RND transporter periplasmic adaptor subunit [Bryobacteraceae bacterium]
MSSSGFNAKFTLAIVVCAVFSGCTKQQPVQAKQDSSPVRVKAVPVAAREVRRVVQSVGTLFPFDEGVISAEIAGRVLEVNADLGDRVNKGQVLVRISDEEQKYILAQTEAQLRMSLERVGLRNENDKVTDIREASEVRRAQADLTDAEQQYKRMRSLADQGIGSRAELDQAQARYNSLRAGYDATINQARNLLQDIERNKASLELQRKKLRDTTVFAPFAGAVKERTVAPGQYVQANTPLVTLVKIDPIRLRLEIPERMAPWIKTGQVADVSMEAYGDRKFQGKIWRISPTVDQTKRTFIVEALIDNPTGELKPGSYARASLPTNKLESVKLIPSKAVNYVFGSNKAYVVTAAQTIETRDVKLGDRFEENVEILEGLEEGEQVALGQLSRLDNGVKVAVGGDAPDAAASKPERKGD